MVEVQLQVVIEDEKVQINSELSSILVIRLDQGRDYFVVVTAIYKGLTTEEALNYKEAETEKIIKTNNDNNQDDWLIKFD